MNRAFRVLGALLCFSSFALNAAHAASVELPFPHFRQSEGKLDGNGLPLSGVKLCLLPSGTSCFEMPPAPLPTSKKEFYQFGLKPQSERLALSTGGSWIFFSGMFFGGGSGMLERVALLRYRADGEIENLMPEVTETELADRAMWNVPKVSPYPVFVRADYIWGDGESHFEPHFFEVDAWEFDPATQRYQRMFSYKTDRRYDRGDGADRVLSAERQEILRRLLASAS